jgi:lipid II:glycine glycyltransferase (peptidoglycan interpeptide bridge formation enzyme)
MSCYRFKIAIDVDEKKWNDDLIKSTYATFFQTYEYLKSDSKDHFPIFIYVTDENDSVVGQLGMQIIGTTMLYSSHFFKKITKFVSSITKRGIWVYGPIIHTNDKSKRLEILQEILNAVDQIAKQYNLVHVEGQTSPLDLLIDNSYKTIFEKNHYSKHDFITYLSDLGDTIDTIWSNVSKKARGDVTRAQKRNFVAKELETLDELKQYLILNQEWAQTKGLVIADPFADIDTLWENHLKGREKFFLAYVDNKLVSGVRVGCFNGICYTNFVINSYYDSTNLGGTLLTWFVVEWAAKNGMRFYDFSGGPKPISESEKHSLLFYKSKWGGKETPYYIFIKSRKKLSYKLYLVLFALIRNYHNFRMRRVKQKINKMHTKTITTEIIDT